MYILCNQSGIRAMSCFPERSRGKDNRKHSFGSNPSLSFQPVLHLENSHSLFFSLWENLGSFYKILGLLLPAFLAGPLMPFCSNYGPSCSHPCGSDFFLFACLVAGAWEWYLFVCIFCLPTVIFQTIFLSRSLKDLNGIWSAKKFCVPLPWSVKLNEYKKCCSTEAWKGDCAHGRVLKV